MTNNQLQSIIERLENVAGQIKELQDDQKDIFAEAKGNGFDVPALKAILKIRKEDAEKREHREAIIETYMQALGMLAETPLGKAALDRVA